MNVFYNPHGVGDVLIIPLQREQNIPFKDETFGDITKITDLDDNILGYNIFNASKHLTIHGTGTIVLTDELFQEIKLLFEKENVDDPLDFDLTPKFVVGYIFDQEQHEDADHLSVCQVDVGDEKLQIVCGAQNVRKGQYVVVAKVGAMMLNGLTIKPTKLRGIESNGMICSREKNLV